MRARLPAAALALLGALALGACDDGDTAPAPQETGAPAAAPEAPAAISVGVAVEAVESKVALGGEILLRVTVTNTGEGKARVNVPRLDRNCATVRVRLPGEDPFVLEHLHAKLVPPGRLEWQMPDAKELAPGESVTGEIALTAAQPGKHHVTVSYRRSVREDPVTAEPLEIVVEPDGDKTHLGARILTSKGALTVRLRPDLAPNTVESFASLARSGFFDGLTFHRIVAGFMAQGGDPEGTGGGGPGYFLPLEANRELLHDRGVLSMARTGIPDTAGSQFFLLFTRYPSLDPGFRGSPGYTTFGETVEGDETLTALESVETVYRPEEVREAVEAGRISSAQLQQLLRTGQAEKSAPKEPVTIESVTLVTLD